MVVAYQTKHTIENLLFKSSDGGVFDTPQARLHLTAKAGWLRFYTAVKIVLAITISVFTISDSISLFIRTGIGVWEKALLQSIITGLLLIIFFVLEKNTLWGLRAYLDASKRNSALETQLRSESSVPIYVAVNSSETQVPATKDRLLTLLFVWSKYFTFLIYTGAIGFFTFVLFLEGNPYDPFFLLEAFILGPVIVFLMARWVFRSEKEIRLTFAGNATLQDDFAALQAKNAQLEAQLQSFEGVNRGDKQVLEQQIQELSEQAGSAQEDSDAQRRTIGELKEQIIKQREIISQRDSAYEKLSKEMGSSQQQQDQERLARDALETRLHNLSTEFGMNCTVDEAFKALSATVGREGGLEKMDGSGLSLLAKLMRDIRTTAPDSFGDAKSLSFVSAEEQRINQYDAIVRLYSQKIQKLRSSDMDEEEQQDAIDAMRRLRDREIAELEGAS
jgi:hypothetical protein